MKQRKKSGSFPSRRLALVEGEVGAGVEEAGVAGEVKGRVTL
jgi:hypothetical protein